jgi:hypothetical protein
MATYRHIWKVTYKVLGTTIRVVHASTTAKALTPKLLEEFNEAVRSDLDRSGHPDAPFAITGIEWVAESVEINGRKA